MMGWEMEKILKIRTKTMKKDIWDNEESELKIG